MNISDGSMQTIDVKLTGGSALLLPGPADRAAALVNSGNLILTSTAGSDYTGGTYVNGGTLTVAITGGIPDNEPLLVGPGATLALDSTPVNWPSGYYWSWLSPVASSAPHAAASGAASGAEPVPEPGTLALLAVGTGVAGFGVWRRRKRVRGARCPATWCVARTGFPENGHC